MLKALRPLWLVGDRDEAWGKSREYSLLALAWGKQAGVDNIDYCSVGIPPEVYDLDDDAAIAKAKERARVVAEECYANVEDIIREVGVEGFVRAMVWNANLSYEDSRNTDLADGFLSRWVMWGVQEYGPHPDGLTVYNLSDDFMNPEWVCDVVR